MMDVFRALHIIFVVTWFAGLFYMVRLLIYHREAQDLKNEAKKVLSDQYLIMEKRLWYGITWPSAILTLILGFSQIHQFMPLAESPWLIVKLILVFLLYLYHVKTGLIYKKMTNGTFQHSSNFLRVWNELATLFLVSIIFLVVLKSNLDFLKATLAFLVFSLILAYAIKLYRKGREKKIKT
jgi:protoporphyrinogen IX oxidase